MIRKCLTCLKRYKCKCHDWKAEPKDRNCLGYEEDQLVLKKEKEEKS